VKVKKLYVLPVVLFLLVALGFSMPKSASAVAVDLELLLLVDVSGSISSTEFNLQRQGYVDAFRDTDVINKIENGAIKSIAASLIYWSTNQVVAVDWALIDDSLSSNAFADSIAAAARPSSGLTYLAEALNFGAPTFDSNGFEGTRNVIDISGDGRDNSGSCGSAFSCVALQNARDAAIAAGTDTINALWIQSSGLVAYGVENVLAGPGAFSSFATNFEDFGDAVLGKIKREIENNNNVVPEPSTYLLLGSGIAGLIVWRRRRKAKA